MHIRFKNPTLHWNYFLSIEAEFIETLKFVEIDKDNFKTFSTAYTKIILSACSEIDVLLKQIGKFFGQKKDRPNFGDHLKFVDKYLTTLKTETIYTNGYDIVISPFEGWTQKDELEWHRTYNNLKHNRGQFYKDGNLEVALESVAALFSTVIHYYCCLSNKDKDGTFVTISDVINSLTYRSNIFKFSNPIHYIHKLD